MCETIFLGISVEYKRVFLWHQAVPAVYQLCVITVTMYSVCLQYPLWLSCFSVWGILLSLWVKMALQCNRTSTVTINWGPHGPSVLHHRPEEFPPLCERLSLPLKQITLEPDSSNATFYDYILYYYNDINSENCSCFGAADSPSILVRSGCHVPTLIPSFIAIA